jgi:hypothetical protein
LHGQLNAPRNCGAFVCSVNYLSRRMRMMSGIGIPTSHKRMGILSLLGWD